MKRCFGCNVNGEFLGANVVVEVDIFKLKWAGVRYRSFVLLRRRLMA